MQAKLDTVKKHMTGKRFNAAKGALCAKQYKVKVCVAAADIAFCHVAEFESDDRELMEEPDIETSEEVSAFAHVCCPQCMPASFDSERYASDLRVQPPRKSVSCDANGAQCLQPPLHVSNISC